MFLTGAIHSHPSLSPLPSQTEEGSSRQENAQKALGAVSKVGRREAEEGRGAKWQRGSGGEYAGMGDWILLTRSLSAAALRWGA